ncbi:MAG TPA: DUF6119 family protein [Leptolyngbyaceae cyanobacterium]
MPKYNIYRINQDKKQNLINKLTLVDLEEISEKQVDDFNFQFFFSKKPDEIHIWWANIFEEFLEGLEQPKNLMYFGVLLISNDDLCYAVSLGKSHFYLRQFCDPDFGLNLAERIIDEKNLKLKNTKYYKSRKSKTITAYQLGSEISFDSGESMHYLKAKTINPSKWGETASFGSSVQFNLSKNPSDLADFIKQIEEELKQPPRLDFPKTCIVKDIKIINELDNRLANAIIKSAENTEINIEEFSVLGIDFIFTDKSEYSLFLKNHKKDKKNVEDLTLEELIKFVKEQNIDLSQKINDIYVYRHNESGSPYSQPLKVYLDFIDEQERYCLIDGKWHKFNQSYLNYLKREVDSINLIYEDKFDIGSSITEDLFNKSRHKEDGYINFDKNLENLNGYKIEKMDLYKDETLFFVKIGEPQKLSYVIDQATNTVKVLQNNESKIKIAEREIDVKNICLWIIFKRKNKISQLSDVHSIIFHMKLVEWKKTVKDAGFLPLIKVNYVID